ncbi:MAG: hypothetical protein ACTHN5_12880 [Phycisphaerae bacterium]
MNTFQRIAIVCTLAVVAGSTWADKIYLKDGHTREGIITDQTDTEYHVKIDDGGLAATISIPRKDVAKIEKGPVKPPEPPPPAPTPEPSNSSVTVQPITPEGTPTQSAAGAGTTQPATMSSTLPPPRGFITEFFASAVGNGPDNINRLPQDLQDLWKEAQAADASGKKATELEALRKLEEAFRNAGALDRLDGLSLKEHNQPFGQWMATVHFAVMSDNYRGGMFDLNDVRDVEREPLIGLMKEKTPETVEPLKSYFPPVNDKTGRFEAFKPTQLSGITVDNALDLKDKALFARALISAQLRLEPQMPPADRQLLSSQLTVISPIISKCTQLEPAARTKARQAGTVPAH